MKPCASIWVQGREAFFLGHHGDVEKNEQALFCGTCTVIVCDEASTFVILYIFCHTNIEMAVQCFFVGFFFGDNTGVASNYLCMGNFCVFVCVCGRHSECFLCVLCVLFLCICKCVWESASTFFVWLRTLFVYANVQERVQVLFVCCDVNLCIYACPYTTVWVCQLESTPGEKGYSAGGLLPVEEDSTDCVLV